MFSYITKKTAQFTARVLDSGKTAGKIIIEDIVAIPKAAKEGWNDGLYSTKEPLESDAITPGNENPVLKL